MSATSSIRPGSHLACTTYWNLDEQLGFLFLRDYRSYFFSDLLCAWFPAMFLSSFLTETILSRLTDSILQVELVKLKEFD